MEHILSQEVCLRCFLLREEHASCYGLFVPPQNKCVEALTPNVMVFGGGFSGGDQI